MGGFRFVGSKMFGTWLSILFRFIPLNSERDVFADKLKRNFYNRLIRPFNNSSVTDGPRIHDHVIGDINRQKWPTIFPSAAVPG